MKKVNISIFLFVLTFSIFLTGCETNDRLNENDDYITVNSKLQKDEDLLSLIQIKNDFTDRLIASKVPIDKIKEAFLTGDDDFIYEALSYSNSEINHVNEIIKTSGFNLINRYPLIKSEVYKRLETDCLDCKKTENADLIFSTLEQTSPMNGLVRLKNDGEMSTGDWVKYTICVAACAVTAPTGPGYFLCCAVCAASFGPF